MDKDLDVIASITGQPAQNLRLRRVRPGQQEFG
jgi:hypothetical protein